MASSLGFKGDLLQADKLRNAALKGLGGAEAEVAEVFEGAWRCMARARNSVTAAGPTGSVMPFIEVSLAGNRHS